ncbi:hypothetical protein [Hymenobacter sp. B81]|uniref:hypothetical protein n=1 Tax=Hymenobacter sp. B81 TaxID=3344878 RepID=UPI0037DC417F
MPILSTEYLLLSHGPSADMLRIMWRRPVSLAELQQGYEQVRAAAVRFRAPLWLVDLRSPGLPRPVEQGHWLHELFLPESYRFFAEPLRLACLMSPEQLAAVWYDPVSTANARTLTDPEQPFQLALFDQEAEAVNWLTQEIV